MINLLFRDLFVAQLSIKFNACIAAPSILFLAERAAAISVAALTIVCSTKTFPFP
ncbi:hypothetical protein ACI6PO_03015 [Agrobacterium tumefaciens]